MYLSELREEFSDMIFLRLRGHIFDEQAEFLHRLFELVSLFLLLFLALVLALKFRDIKRGAVVHFCLLERRESLLSILLFLKADEAEPLALVRVVTHDRYTCDLTELFEQGSQVIFCKLSSLFSWKIFDVEIRRALLSI